MSNSVREQFEALQRTAESSKPEFDLLRRRFNSLGLLRQLTAIQNAGDMTLAVFTKQRQKAGEPVAEIIASLDLQLDAAGVSSLVSKALSRVSPNKASLIAPMFVSMPDRARQALQGLQYGYQGSVEEIRRNIGRLHKNLPLASELLVSFSTHLEWAQTQAVYEARVAGRTWTEIGQELTCSGREAAFRFREDCHEEALFDYDEFCLSSHPLAINERLETFERLDRFTLSHAYADRRELVALSLEAEQSLPGAQRLKLQRERIQDRAQARGRRGYCFPESLCGLEADSPDIVVAKPDWGTGVSAQYVSGRRAAAPTTAIGL